MRGARRRGDPTGIDLHDYLAEKFADARTDVIELGSRLTQRMDERWHEYEKALGLQAAEYERRLTALNGEYQRDAARQRDYATTTYVDTKLDAVLAAIKTLDNKNEVSFVGLVQKHDDLQHEWSARFHALEEFRSMMQGGQGSRQRAQDVTARTFSFFVAAAGVAIAVASLVTR